MKATYKLKRFSIKRSSMARLFTWLNGKITQFNKQHGNAINCSLMSKIRSDNSNIQKGLLNRFQTLNLKKISLMCK